MDTLSWDTCCCCGVEGVAVEGDGDGIGLAESIDNGRDRGFTTLGMEKERAMAARDEKEEDGECAGN